MIVHGFLELYSGCNLKRENTPRLSERTGKSSPWRRTSWYNSRRKSEGEDSVRKGTELEAMN